MRQQRGREAVRRTAPPPRKERWHDATLRPTSIPGLATHARLRLPSLVGAALAAWAGVGAAAGDSAAPAAPAAAVSAWSTGGTSATARPTDTDGKPAGAVAGPSSAPLPYWQAPAVPSAVVQGGAIPPGWQPQAVPYQGIGPDGRPITMYVAPTYVFTYQAGPPVLATPQVSRRRSGGVMRPGVATDPYATGWNYRSSGATPVAPTLPPATVARYAPAPYQFPSDARALTGTPLVPPAAPPAPSVPPVWAQPPVVATPPSPAWSQPPVGWMPATATPANIGPPPAGWTGVSPSAVPAPPGFTAAVGLAAPAGAAAETPPPLASLPPPVAPIPTASPAGPQPIPLATGTASSSAVSTSNVHVWKVVAVYDGDTVTCLDEHNQQQKVRLADIDAPESGQDFGKASRDALANLVFGRTVQVVDDGRDRYGRWIGRLFVDGTDVNRELVATGMAWHYADYSQDDTLAAVQAQARARQLGLWSQPNPIAPAEYRKQASQKS